MKSKQEPSLWKQQEKTRSYGVDENPACRNPRTPYPAAPDRFFSKLQLLWSIALSSPFTSAQSWVRGREGGFHCQEEQGKNKPAWSWGALLVFILEEETYTLNRGSSHKMEMCLWARSAWNCQWVFRSHPQEVQRISTKSYENGAHSSCLLRASSAEWVKSSYLSLSS